MMRNAVLALALVVTGVGTASAAERRFSVNDFDRVRVIGAVQVDIQRNRATTAIARGTPDAIDDVVLTVKGTELTIAPRPRPTGQSRMTVRGPATVMITSPRLIGIQLSGSGRVTADTMSGLQTAISVAGSGSVSVDQMAADRAAFSLTGSGMIMAGGAVKSLKVNADGSGSISAQDMIADDVTLATSISGSIALTAKRTAKVAANGSGGILITGSAACTVSNVGSGDVRCGR